MILFYSKVRKNGEILKPKKIIADTKDMAMKIVKDNNPKYTIMFFDSLEEYAYESIRNKDNVEKNEKETLKEKFNITDESLKVWDWLQEAFIGGQELNYEFVKDYQLNIGTDKPYYVQSMYGPHQDFFAHFATKEEIIEILNNALEGGTNCHILEVATSRDMIPVIKDIKFEYEWE